MNQKKKKDKNLKSNYKRKPKEKRELKIGRHTMTTGKGRQSKEEK
jgi:hypothetical protein